MQGTLSRLASGLLVVLVACGGPAEEARVPGAPTDVQVSAGEAAASVSWKAPASDGGSPITGYRVRARPGEAVALVEGGAREARLTGLSNGTAYTFTVVALNAVGEGPAATSSEVVPQPLVRPPDAPAQLRAVAGDGQVRVSWEAPARDGGSPITGYTLTVLPEGRGVPLEAQAREHLVTGLTNGQEYRFSVAASNGAGLGPAASTPESLVPAMRPGAPRQVSVRGGQLSAEVSWLAPTRTGGVPLLGYRVTASPGGQSVEVDARTLSARFEGLRPGSPVTFSVSALNSGGQGEASRSAAFHPFGFQGGSTLSTAGALAVGLGDFDADGVLDVVAPEHLASRVQVWRGRGAAGFHGGQQVPTGSSPTDVVVADFNQDGRPDVGVVSQEGLRLLPGNGNGQLLGGSVLLVGAGLGRLASGDFNGDGTPDLAATSASESHLTVAVLASSGRAISAVKWYALSGVPSALATADLNRDGRLDLLVTTSAATLEVLSGKGDGTFHNARPLPAVAMPGELVVVDLNGDGLLDVAMTSQREQGALGVRLGQGDGSFGPLATSALEGALPLSLAAGDFNQDGHVDLAYAASASVRLLLNGGEGTFSESAAQGFEGASLVRARDVNGDGKVDLLVGGYSTGGLSVWQSY